MRPILVKYYEWRKKNDFRIEDRWDAISGVIDVDEPDPKFIINLVKGFYGVQGIRDHEHPCNEYDNTYGEPGFVCETDGHYMCLECRHISMYAIQMRMGCNIATLIK